MAKSKNSSPLFLLLGIGAVFIALALLAEPFLSKFLLKDPNKEEQLIIGAKSENSQKPNQDIFLKYQPQWDQTTQQNFLKAYFDLQSALAKDDTAQSISANSQLGLFFSDSNSLQDLPLLPMIQRYGNSQKLQEIRILFHQYSQITLSLIQRNHLKNSESAYLFFCPMAFQDSGAYWVQNEPNLLNPYFGASMLTCGSQIKKLF